VVSTFIKCKHDKTKVHNIYIRVSTLPTTTNVTMLVRGQTLCSLAVGVLVYSSCLCADYMHKNKTCTAYIFISNLVITLPCIVVHVRTCKQCLFPEPKLSQVGDLSCIRRLYCYLKQGLLLLLGFGASANTLSIILWPYTLHRIDTLQCGLVVDLATHSVVATVTYAGMFILVIPSITYIWKSVMWNFQFPCHPCCIPCLNQCSKCSQYWHTNTYHEETEV
jgi:hypothetical protein